MKKSVIFVLTFTFCALVLAGIFNTSLYAFSLKAFSGVKSVFTNSGVAFYDFLSSSRLRHENEELKKEISRLNAQDTQIEMLKSENTTLRSSLGLRRNSAYNILCTVSIVDINTTGGFSLTVDRGARQGIKSGDVAVWGGALAGKVSQVFDNYSLITPVSAPYQTTGVCGIDDDSGTVTGSGRYFRENICLLSFFGENANIAEGDTIVTSGMSDIYPAGLTVGKVCSTDSDIKVKTDIDFFKIRTLTIVRISR